MNKLKIIFICTSNRDRSPALERYIKEIEPSHEYKSAGVNEYFCKKNGTHLVTKEDIEWADILVFAEDIHFKIVKEKFDGDCISNEILIFSKLQNYRKLFTILNSGDYQQGDVSEEYLTKSEYKIKLAMKSLTSPRKNNG